MGAMTAWIDDLEGQVKAERARAEAAEAALASLRAASGRLLDAWTEASFELLGTVDENQAARAAWDGLDALLPPEAPHG